MASALSGLLPFLFMFAIFGFFVIKGLKTLSQIKNFTKDKTYNDYIARNPDCHEGGKVLCYNCKANNIWLKEVGKTPKSILNSHVCRQCGTELYRSILTA